MSHIIDFTENARLWLLNDEKLYNVMKNYLRECSELDQVDYEEFMSHAGLSNDRIFANADVYDMTEFLQGEYKDMFNFER